MNKWLVGILIGVLGFLVVGLGWVYTLGGLGYYIKVVSRINKLPEEKRVLIRAGFDGTNDERVYSGVLAGLWNKRVWVWGKGGIKSFKPDANSIYSFADGCSDLKVRLPGGGKRTYNVERKNYTDWEEWGKLVKPGDYVTIIRSMEGSGGEVGNLREIWVYNWWIFMQEDMQTACEK
jgi:hypothetical protein